MTFDEFRATGRDCNDLGKALNRDDIEGARGRIYADTLYIEAYPGREGDWLVTTDGCEQHSGELMPCEAMLFVWAAANLYFTPTAAKDA